MTLCYMSDLSEKQIKNGVIKLEYYHPEKETNITYGVSVNSSVIKHISFEELPDKLKKLFNEDYEDREDQSEHVKN